MGDDYPTIISFYTQNWKYPSYATAMKRDCTRLGLQHHIVERADTRDWLKNTRLKPKFIYETLLELKRPVLWIDVDGSILKVPEIFKADYPFDFAAKKKSTTSERIWHVGTMYFNYTPSAMDFLKEWNDKIVDEKWSDELSLDLLWKQHKESSTNLRTDELPVQYFKMLNANAPDPNNDTVICHRASKGDSKMAYKRNFNFKD
jgi:hypothetical protein